jgi:hypothetical protein
MQDSGVDINTAVGERRRRVNTLEKWDEYISQLTVEYYSREVSRMG